MSSFQEMTGPNRALNKMHYLNLSGIIRVHFSEKNENKTHNNPKQTNKNHKKKQNKKKKKKKSSRFSLTPETHYERDKELHRK